MNQDALSYVIDHERCPQTGETRVYVGPPHSGLFVLFKAFPPPRARFIIECLDMHVRTNDEQTDLEVAERQVESLEDEVTELRGQLDSMCDGADVSFASDGSSDGGGSGSTGGGRSAERSKEVSRGKQELRHRRKVVIRDCIYVGRRMLAQYIYLRPNG